MNKKESFLAKWLIGSFCDTKLINWGLMGKFEVAFG